MARTRSQRSGRQPTLREVTDFLRGLDQEALVQLLVDQANRDRSFFERLQLHVASAGDAGVLLATYRAALRNAIQVPDFVDYAEAGSYTEHVARAVDSLENLLRDGNAEAVVELTEYAIRELDEAMNQVDDSNGYLSTVLTDLIDLHAAACRRARSETEQLGQRLLALELGTDYVELDVPRRYWELLGPAGQASYRRAAEAEWSRVQPLGPNDAGRRGDHPRRFWITEIMESLVEQDLEALVEVKSRDLSSPARFLTIAKVYRDANLHDQAFEWAKRGVAAFPDGEDRYLDGFLADEYQRRGRHAEAMALVWRHFDMWPSLAEYQALKEHGERGAQWPAWRDRALARLRQPSAGQASSWEPRDRSELVAVLLWDGNVDAAWQEAVDGGCGDVLWRRLAAAREADHPAGVLPVYRRLVEAAVDRKSNDAYGEAVELMKRARTVMKRLGKGADFTGYVADVRAKHRPKRNLMRMLDAAGW